MTRKAASCEYIRTEKTGNTKLLKALSGHNKHKGISDTIAPNDNGPWTGCHPQLRNDSHVWSYHLITILTSDGSPVRILTIIDEGTQECLCNLAANHVSTQNVVDKLFSLFLQRGIPKYLFAFNYYDAMPKGICEWLKELEIDSIFVQLKKYEDNGYGALFKGKLIKDLFNEKFFASLAEVQLWLENWRNEHNRSINLLWV